MFVYDQRINCLIVICCSILGTPATQSQMAKDVACFLKWASEPEHDIRKRWAFKLLVMIPPIAAIIYYWKRHQWSYMKSRKFVFRSPRKPSAD
ncbi:conserved hypothetical protein [Trichinella spiralis]|uniref:hypothetical protein n=1 Tax=Trichinella spiralis TaxID=6334 RepID=UPI0001EFDCEC|nr:conserved hypothetical protein [Trichinella spiralis]